MKRIRVSLFKFIMIFILLLQVFTVEIAGPMVVNATEIKDVYGSIDVCMHKSDLIMNPYIEAFKKKYPNVEVNYTCLENYEDSITEMINSDDTPDVFFIPGSVSYSNYEKYLVPLGTVDEYEKKYNYMDKAAVKDDIVYGIPSFTYMFGLIYNRRIFEQAGIVSLPKTMEDFEYDCSLIKKYTEAIPLYTNYNDPWALTYWESFPFIEMHGPTGYRYNDYIYKKKPFSEGESHYQVYQLLYNLVKNGYTEKIGDGSYAKASADLCSGKVATMVMGSWAFKEIQYIGADDGVLGFMPFPNSVDGKQYVTVSGDYCYGVSPSCENIDAAKAFIGFMIDESGYAVDSGNISILKTDPYADFINQMNQITMLTETEATDQAYMLLDSLQTYIKPGSMEEVSRIIDSASGRSDESFDDIMKDWNSKWERGRPIAYAIDTSVYDNAKVDITNDAVYISESEQQYIDNNPILKVGYISTFAPFSYEVDGTRTGLIFDVCEIINEQTGLEIEYESYDSPKEAVEALEAGEVQMVAGLSSSKNSKLKFSKSFYDVLNVYLCKDSVDVSNLSEYKIAVDEGEINNNITSLDNKVLAENLPNCFDLLNDGSVDYLISNSASAGYYMKDKECENIETVPASSYSNLSMAFADKADSALIALVNKCIYTISNEKLQGKLLQYSIPPDKELTYERLLKKNPVFIFGVFFAIFGVILVAILIILIFRIRSNRILAVEMKKYELLSDLAEEYMFDIDCRKKTARFDIKFREQLDYPAMLSSKSKEKDIKKCEEFLDHLKRVWVNSELQEDPFKVTMKNGEKNWFRMILLIINDSKGRPQYGVGKIVNIQKEVEELQTYQNSAQKDALTEILNRRGFESYVPEAASKVVYIVTDIDDFKNVNDSIGHSGGDAVLCEMAQTLKIALGENAIVARFGGDEFIALIPDIEYEEADNRLKAFVSEMDREYIYEGISHHISVSAGGVYSKDEIKITEMFDIADKILYKKKNAGKNGYILEEIS